MKVGILALQGDVREHALALADVGAEPTEVRQAEQLCGMDALVLPGGESTTMSMLLESSGLFDPVAERLADGMPAFGTCAGMILLARRVLDGRADQRTFGAIDLTVRRNAFGRQVDSFEADLPVPEVGPDPVPAVFIRAPIVEEVGPSVEVLATVTAPREGGADMAPSVPGDAGGAPARPVLCRQGGILVAAFHPELSGDRRLHELFLRGV